MGVIMKNGIEYGAIIGTESVIKRFGTFSTMDGISNGWVVADITFDKPMPNTDYCVIAYFTDVGVLTALTPGIIENKTINGFTYKVYHQGDRTSLNHGEYYVIANKNFYDCNYDYSTVAHKTGGKWTDGKDIYTQTFEIQNPNTSWQVIDVEQYIGSFDTFIRCVEVKAYRTDGAILHNTFIVNDSDRFQYLFVDGVTDTEHGLFIRSAGAGTISKIIFTIEFTK